MPYHVFGKHENCGDFCKGHRTDSPQDSFVGDDATNDSLKNIIDDQAKYWSDGFTAECMEESRYSTNTADSLDNRLINEILKIVNRIANKAERLIDNATSNLSEYWMGLRSKFDVGKITNKCFKSAWNCRCYAAGLRWNIGPEWAPLTFKKCFEAEPGYNYKKVYIKRKHKRNLDKSYANKASS